MMSHDRVLDLEVLATKRLDPQGYLRSYIDNYTRFDGRELRKRRRVVMNAGEILPTENIVGSSVLSMGWTKVVAVCTTERIVPSYTTPDRGQIDFKVQIGPICSSKYEDKHVAHSGALVEEYLRASLIKSGAIDLKQLCVQEGRHAHRLTCHLTFVSLDGSIRSAALIAALSALMDAKIPMESFSSSGDRVIDSALLPRALTVCKCPMPVSIGVVDSKILVDLSEEEESLIEAVAEYVVCQGGEIVFSEAHFNGSIPPDTLKNIIAVAIDETDQLRTSLGFN